MAHLILLLTSSILGVKTYDFLIWVCLKIESLTLNFDSSKMLKLMFPVKIVIWMVIVHCQTLPYQVLGSMVRSEKLITPGVES